MLITSRHRVKTLSISLKKIKKNFQLLQIALKNCPSGSTSMRIEK